MLKGAAFILAAALVATPATADPETVPTTGAVSDEELRAFGEARPVVDGVVEALRLILSEARADGAEVAGLRFAAQLAVEAAALERGLSPPRYNAIQLAVRRHPELRRRLARLSPGDATSPESPSTVQEEEEP